MPWALSSSLESAYVNIPPSSKFGATTWPRVRSRLIESLSIGVPAPPLLSDAEVSVPDISAVMAIRCAPTASDGPAWCVYDGEEQDATSVLAKSISEVRFFMG